MKKYYMPGSRPGKYRKNRAAYAIQKAFRRRRKRKMSSIVKTNRRKINKLMNAEVAFRDQVYSTNISSSGAFLQIGIQSIDQGDGEGQRQGDKITIKSINMKAHLSVLNGTISNGDAFNNIRLILLKLPQPNTNAPLLVTDILQVNNWQSHYRKKSDVKFTVLHDKTYYMDNQGFGTGASSDPKWQPVHCHQKNCSFKIKFPKGLDVTFNTGSQNVYQNDIRLFVLSDSAVVGHPSLNGYLRMTYLP